MAARTDGPDTAHPAARLRALVTGPPAALAVLVLALLAFAVGWAKWGETAISNFDRGLQHDKLAVTPQPAWLVVDVKAEVFRDGSLRELSMLDKDVAFKVYRAFKMHPWVADVNRVNKLSGGRITVDLEYRRPIAWVEIPPQMSPNGKPSLLPIDREAVVLAPQDLSLGDMPRIFVANLPQWGMKGTHWGDARIAAAAEICSLLREIWQPLGLNRIVCEPSGIFVLMSTRSEDRAVWGSAPGRELQGESNAEQKVQILASVAKSTRPLPNNLDLRIANSSAVFERIR